MRAVADPNFVTESVKEITRDLFLPSKIPWIKPGSGGSIRPYMMEAQTDANQMDSGE